MKVVIVGAGEVGFNIASKLAFEDKEVVVIDKNVSALKYVSENIDVKTVEGLGSDPLVLEKAGLRESEVLLAVSDSDEGNLATCLMADIISPSTKKLARIRSNSFPLYYKELRFNRPHIDTIINPDLEVVKTIENFINFPGAIDIIDFEGGYIKFVGVRMTGKSILVNKKLYDLMPTLKKTKILIVAVVRNEKLIIPRGKDKLIEGDLTYFITIERKLVKTMILFDPEISPVLVKRVLIVGGGNIGCQLAEKLEKRYISCKIIDRNEDRCEFLAKKLNRTVVLHGDGSDQSLLSEENISETDVVITLTNDEETNVLISLLAKRMGAKKTITQVSKFSYSSFMPTIGIEQVISSRLSAVNTILHHMRRGKILSSVSIKNECGEVMEAIALPTSDVVLKPLRKIIFPKGAMVASIIKKNDIIIPNGDSIIEPGDRIIIFAKSESISGVEMALSVKLEYF